jgi:hypothetical protein
MLVGSMLVMPGLQLLFTWAGDKEQKDEKSEDDQQDSDDESLEEFLKEFLDDYED